ncbi:hypothetical protein RMCBS344292_05932 [Rhizopus microsporus]|nr:hypothetical protein RMCBS344292_05932 [Rhizopus microsporus]
MVSFMKKKLGELAGMGDPSLLPPPEYLSEEDCLNCSEPCPDHKEYPSYLNIEKDFPILGSVKPYGRHIIIATGSSDWPKHIESDKDSFASSLYQVECNSRSQQSWKNLVTNSNMVSTYSTLPDGYDILLYPDNILISNVTQDKAQDFYDIFINTPLPTSPINIEKMMKHEKIGDMKVQKSPYKSTLLLCSHKKRDKRCGVTAPILAQELDHVLREKGLDEYDAAIIMVSHIGGHKFAGNVICYINEGSKGVWYGRVKTCHSAAIVEETIMKGKVIKDLYRGAMDNSFENQQKRSVLKW